VWICVDISTSTRCWRTRRDVWSVGRSVVKQMFSCTLSASYVTEDDMTCVSLDLVTIAAHSSDNRERMKTKSYQTAAAAAQSISSIHLDIIVQPTTCRILRTWLTYRLTVTICRYEASLVLQVCRWPSFLGLLCCVWNGLPHITSRVDLTVGCLLCRRIS